MATPEAQIARAREEERRRCENYKYATYAASAVVVIGVAYTIYQNRAKIEEWWKGSSSSSTSSTTSGSSGSSNSGALRGGRGPTAGGSISIVEHLRRLDSGSKATNVTSPIYLTSEKTLGPGSYIQSVNGRFFAQQHESGALQVLCGSGPSDPRATIFFTTGARKGVIQGTGFHTALRSDDKEHVFCTYSGVDQSANGPPIWCAPLREEYSLEKHGKPILRLTDLGQLALYGDKMNYGDTPLWQSPNASNRFDTKFAWRKGQFLQSANRQFYAIAEADGPITIYRANNPMVERDLTSQLVWTSADAEFPKSSSVTWVTRLLPDGRLVTRKQLPDGTEDTASKAAFDSQVVLKESQAGRGALLLVLTNQGRLQIAPADDLAHPIWITPLPGTRSVTRGGSMVGPARPAAPPAAAASPAAAAAAPAAPAGPAGRRAPGPLVPPHAPAGASRHPLAAAGAAVGAGVGAGPMSHRYPPPVRSS